MIALATEIRQHLPPIPQPAMYQRKLITASKLAQLYAVRFKSLHHVLVDGAEVHVEVLLPNHVLKVVGARVGKLLLDNLQTDRFPNHDTVFLSLVHVLLRLLLLCLIKLLHLLN